MADDTIRKWAQSADLTFDQATGALLVKMLATITADVIDADIFGITGGNGGNPGTGGKSLVDVVAAINKFGPCSKVLASGVHVPASTTNGQAFPAAPAGTKRMVIAPRLADSGDPANGSVCFLRHDNANTKAGAPIKPSDGLVNVNTTDPTQFFLKIITAGDGVYYLYLGD